MIFPTVSTSILGFATLAVAAPHLHSRFERNFVAPRLSVEAVEQGIFPRGHNNVLQDITITNTQTEEQITSNGIQTTDVELVKEIQQRIIVVDNSRQLRDNVRRNTFNARNSNVNTVVIVVTQVLDQRDSSNVNTRYLTRQLNSNSNIAEQQIIVVSESEIMTISSNSNSNGQSSPTGVSSAQSTGSVQESGIYDPSAVAALSTQVQTLPNGQVIIGQQILPVGAAAPTWSNAQFSQDPAEILEVSPKDAVFVSFEAQDQSQESSAAIVITQVDAGGVTTTTVTTSS